MGEEKGRSGKKRESKRGEWRGRGGQTWAWIGTIATSSPPPHRQIQPPGHGSPSQSLLTEPNNIGVRHSSRRGGDGEQTLTHWQIGNRSWTHKAYSLKKLKKQLRQNATAVPQELCSVQSGCFCFVLVSDAVNRQDSVNEGWRNAQCNGVIFSNVFWCITKPFPWQSSPRCSCLARKWEKSDVQLKNLCWDKLYFPLSWTEH